MLIQFLKLGILKDPIITHLANNRTNQLENDIEKYVPLVSFGYKYIALEYL